MTMSTRRIGAIYRKELREYRRLEAKARGLQETIEPESGVKALYSERPNGAGRQDCGFVVLPSNPTF